MKIIWNSRALDDLNHNISHIADKSPQNAQHVLNTLTKLAESLTFMPYKFPKEPVYNVENIRFAIKWSFKLIYRVEAEEIYILRVFNTNQNPNKITG